MRNVYFLHLDAGADAIKVDCCSMRNAYFLRLAPKRNFALYKFCAFV